MKLINPSAFANDFVAHAVEPGFGSLSKRDLELLIYYLLERDGAVQRSAKTYDVGTMLNVPIAKAKSYRRDAYARWRRPFGEQTKLEMKSVLKAVLSEEALETAEKHAGRLVKQDGFIPVWIEHPIDRVDFEQAILDAGGIPRRDHHPDVLFVRFDVLTRIATTYFSANSVASSIKSLKKIAPAVEEVRALLTKDIKEITFSDVRSTINDLGIKVTNGLIDAKVGDLYKALFAMA